MVEGPNVFAVEVHNVTEGSSDLTARPFLSIGIKTCLLYTSDAADERSSVDLGGRRIIKKKKIIKYCDQTQQHSKQYVILKSI